MEGYDYALRQELLSLADADQHFRRTWAGLDGDASRDAMTTEHARAARLAEIVDERGWPGAPLVGDDGTRAAWLIVQHADHDVDFQERALALVASAVQRGEAPRAHRRVPHGPCLRQPRPSSGVRNAVDTATAQPSGRARSASPRRSTHGAPPRASSHSRPTSAGCTCSTTSTEAPEPTFARLR